MLRKGGREEGREGSHTKFRTCACSLCSRVSLFSSESLFLLLSRALCQSLLSLFSRASLLSSLARALSVSSLSVCLFSLALSLALFSVSRSLARSLLSVSRSLARSLLSRLHPHTRTHARTHAHIHHTCLVESRLTESTRTQHTLALAHPHAHPPTHPPVALTIRIPGGQTLPAAGLHIVGAGRLLLHSHTESAFSHTESAQSAQWRTQAASAPGPIAPNKPPRTDWLAAVHHIHSTPSKGTTTHLYPCSQRSPRNGLFASRQQ